MHETAAYNQVYKYTYILTLRTDYTKTIFGILWASESVGTLTDR